ncbi:hypothetical protein R3W88_028560 [Solanum pinnatisectum]|uniref:RING-type E3 ubiquitin transferase n=1 Tax=Solanum pinnatisectum TaxID=50273 RepID=A0AAV9K2U9_9SOLN|nr:hypothetical protein R3W88_028560 [Solanum pinnatisectum]
MVNFGEKRHHFSSQITFRSRPIFNLHQYNKSSGNIRTDLPTLVLQCSLFARQEAWRKSPVNQPSELIYLDEFYKFETRSFEVKICPSQYRSHDVFFSVLKEHLTNWGDYYEVSDDYVIKRIILYIDKIIEYVSKRGGNTNCEYLEIFLDIALKLEYVLDGRMREIPWRLNGGMVPATKTSIMELPERMEIDDDQCLKETECVICLEQLVPKKEGGKIICMPCSHMFHGDCIITWLDTSHYCPICRYDLPTCN